MAALDCAEARTPGRTVLGDEQERWLLDGLGSSEARWDLVCQQSPVVAVDHDPGPGQAFVMDQWDGYTSARDRLLEGFVAGGVRNPVVLSGDLHRHMVADLRLGGEVVASELVTTSITSRGDGHADPPPEKDFARWCPDIRCVIDRRGYLGVRVTPVTLVALMHTLDVVSKPRAPLRTPVKAVLHDGQRGFSVQRA